MSKQMLFTAAALIFLAAGSAFAASNPAAYLKTEAQKASIATLKDIDGGLLYTMDYSADYMLDDVLKSDIDSAEAMLEYIRDKMLLEGAPAGGAADAGCSAFTAKTADGKILYGRNFDYKMKMTSIMIRTKPEGHYASIGVADAGWAGYEEGSISDGKTDLSLLAGAPYLIMDGMNEKGLAVSVLKLRSAATRQENGKNKIMTAVALRLMLDRAKDVDEAVALLERYDMQSAMPDANFHFCIADATGRTVVVEYGPGNGKLHVLEENYVTNFYLTPGYDDQSRGLDRYNIIKETLSFKKGILTDTEAMSLLELVSQPETEEATSMTQWSAVYNLTDLTLQLAMKRDYKKQFSFAMEEERGSHGGGCSAGAAPFALAALAPLALFIGKSKKLKK